MSKWLPILGPRSSGVVGLHAVVSPRASVAILKLNEGWRRRAALELNLSGDQLAELDRAFDAIRESANLWHDEQLATSASGSTEGSGSGDPSSSASWLTVEEAARRAGCSPRWIRALADSGQLGASEKVGRQWSIDPEAIRRIGTAA